MTTSPQPPVIDLGSARCRASLPASLKPYWELVQPGLYLGLYKGARVSSWYGRKFVGKGKYQQVALGRAREPDRRKGPGLTHEQALQALLAWEVAQPAGATGARGQAAPRNGQAPAPGHPLAPSRLDEISVAWAAERPDIDFWLAGFFLRIEYAHVRHESRVEQMSRELGVNSGDLHVLLALRRNGAGRPMRPTDLFRELLITSGAITKRLDNLHAAKLVERVASPEDRRSELVQLTPAGRRLADAAMTRISTSLSAIVEASGVQRQELQAADAVMRRLIACM